MRISDWSSDVCSSDLLQDERPRYVVPREVHQHLMVRFAEALRSGSMATLKSLLADDAVLIGDGGGIVTSFPKPLVGGWRIAKLFRSEEHTSELQSLMRISYAVFCLKKKKKNKTT